MRYPVHPGRIVRHDCLETLCLSVTSIDLPDVSGLAIRRDEPDPEPSR